MLLLCDIFENFRKTALSTHGLDPANYYTLPGFTWDALLKISGQSLELLSDIDMHQFVEHGLRGGISVVSHRHAKANNPLMTEYDASKPTVYLQYLDANNLYGWAMSQHLPVSGFAWKEPAPSLVQNILDLPSDSSMGYMLECDLSVPVGVHDYLNDYPPAPESVSVQTSMLSPYQHRLVKDLKVAYVVLTSTILEYIMFVYMLFFIGGLPGFRVHPQSVCVHASLWVCLYFFFFQISGIGIPKLAPNLMSKERYVVHYRNLQLYLSLGMELKKVHRILCFNQKPWMKSYIDKNTELRRLATNDFEKNYYKVICPLFYCVLCPYL